MLRYNWAPSPEATGNFKSLSALKKAGSCGRRDIVISIKAVSWCTREINYYYTCAYFLSFEQIQYYNVRNINIQCQCRGGFGIWCCVQSHSPNHKTPLTWGIESRGGGGSFTDRGERKLGLWEAEFKRLVVYSLTSLPVVGESTVTDHYIKKHSFF